MDNKTFLMLTGISLEDEKPAEDIGGFVLECRTGEAFNPEWWQVAIEQAEAVGRLPCLAHQIEGRPWQAQVYAKDLLESLHGTDYTLTLELDALLLIPAKTDPLDAIGEG